MKIAFIAQPFDIVPPLSHTGSMSIWLEELSTRISSEHDVTAYSRKTQEYSDNSEKNKVKHIRVSTYVDEAIARPIVLIQKVLLKIFKKFTFIYYRLYYFKLYYYLLYIVAISLKIKQEKFDIVVVSNFSQFLPIIKFFNKKTKLVIVMHCDWLIELDSKIISRRLENVDAILGVSNYIMEGVKSKFPQFKNKCHTLCNGGNQTAFRKVSKVTNTESQAICKELGLEKEKIVLFLGRITPEKGVHILIDAMKLVLKLYPDCVLLIGGGFYPNPPNPIWLRNSDSKFKEFEVLKNNYQEYLKNLSQGIKDKVKILGDITHNKLPLYYSLCDTFAHPSVWNEPCSLTLFEAMACECPVISTYTGGTSEVVVHGKTGLLVKPNDPQVLADAILQLLENKTLSKQMGSEGRKRIEKEFSWDKTSQAFLNILDKMAGQSNENSENNLAMTKPMSL